MGAGMRSLLVVLVLTAFGCAELRYPQRTEMVEVAPDPARAAPTADARAEAEPAPDLHRRSRHGLVIGGTIASVVGAALLIGGGVGWQRQADRNAAEEADCLAKGGWLCGLFDEFTYLPYGFMVGMGSAAVITGVVLFGIHAHRSR